MMLTKGTWLVSALGATGILAGTVAAAHSFVPGLEDVKDPLGRPSALSREVIFSASEFDRLTGILVPKHTDLRTSIGVLNGVATDLATVVGRAGELSPLSRSVNADTGTVVHIATPLPGLIGNVTGRAEQANSAVSGLGNSIGSVTSELERVVRAQRVVYSDLTELGPRAEKIAAVLSEIEKSSQRVKPVGPLLPLVSGGSGG